MIGQSEKVEPHGSLPAIHHIDTSSTTALQCTNLSIFPAKFHIDTLNGLVIQAVDGTTTILTARNTLYNNKVK